MRNNFLLSKTLSDKLAVILLLCCVGIAAMGTSIEIPQGQWRKQPTGTMRYQLPAPIPFGKIRSLTLDCNVACSSPSWNFRILLYNRDGGIAYYNRNHQKKTHDFKETVSGDQWRYYRFKPESDQVVAIGVSAQFADADSTVIAVGNARLELFDWLITGVDALREVAPGETFQVKYQVEGEDKPAYWRLSRLDATPIIASGAAKQRQFQIPIAADLKSGFYQITLHPDETGASPRLAQWVFHVLPAVEITAFDADRVCQLPSEEAVLSVVLKNHLQTAKTLPLQITGMKERTVTLAPGERREEKFRLRHAPGRRVITAKIGDLDCAALRMDTGDRRPALSRESRVYVNIGQDDHEHIQTLGVMLKASGLGGVSTPGMSPKPVAWELARKFALPMTGEAVLRETDIRHYNLGSTNRNGDRFFSVHSEDKSMRGTLEAWKNIFRCEPGDPRREAKIVEPVDFWSVPGDSEVACYSPDAIQNFRKILAGKDEGFRILEDKRMVRRIKFAEFYRFYEGEELPENDWSKYQPIRLPRLTLSGNVSAFEALSEEQLRQTQLLYLLRRYNNLCFVDRLSQDVAANGIDCGIIPSFYANITARDIYFDYALPYLDNFYHEPFGSAWSMIRDLDLSNYWRRELANRFGKRLSVCMENGGPRNVPYWGTAATRAMVYTALATLGGGDLQVDFWEKLAAPKPAEELFQQHRTIVETAAYFKAHPSKTLADRRAGGMLVVNFRNHIRLLADFHRQNTRHSDSGGNPQEWKFPEDELQRLLEQGYRPNYLRFWNIPGVVLPKMDAQTPVFYRRNPDGVFAKDDNAQSGSREIRTSGGRDIYPILFADTGFSTFHLVLVDRREPSQWVTHYHKKPHQFDSYRTMDELAETLEPTSPVTVEILHPVPAGKYAVIEPFSQRRVAVFHTPENRFVLPGIKIAVLYRIEKTTEGESLP
ncbi:MAG: hypothetical protein PHI35_04955 [Victivallaceae bacterium]|nr:hypothetical protein [Victivallaceae bacterium]